MLQTLYPTYPTIFIDVKGITGLLTDPFNIIPGDKFYKMYDEFDISVFISNIPPSELHDL